MVEKKQTRGTSPRKSTRSAKLDPAIDRDQHRASDTTIATARNAVIQSNVAIDIDAIRQRAYELYEERGGQHGLHEDDWYRAEQEIRARKSNSRKTPPQKKSA